MAGNGTKSGYYSTELRSRLLGKAGDMLMLGLDTCLDACSVALWRAEAGLLAARAEPMRQGHAERLFPMIAEVLAEVDRAPGEIGGIAVTVGPGTFTGTRIGIAAARGLALSTGARVHAATSLALLAATARAVRPQLTARSLAVCQDARKGEVLVEVLRPDASAGLDRVRLLQPDAAATCILDAAPDAVLVGSGASLVADAAARRGALLECLGLPDLQPEARWLARLPLAAVARPVPLYARSPDAKPPADAAIARAP